MGLFDFLKGKRTAARSEAQSMQASLDALGEKLGGKPRFWHHFMAHVALRDIALRGDGLSPDGVDPARAQGLFAFVLGKMAAHLGIAPAEVERLAAGFTIHRRSIGGINCAIVELPRPEGPTECQFVALVPATAGAGARYFTLEYAGGGEWMLGGWDAEERHLNFGEGPEPTLENFVAAVAAKL